MNRKLKRKTKINETVEHKEIIKKTAKAAWWASDNRKHSVLEKRRRECESCDKVTDTGSLVHAGTTMTNNRWAAVNVYDVLCTAVSIVPRRYRATSRREQIGRPQSIAATTMSTPRLRAHLMRAAGRCGCRPGCDLACKPPWCYAQSCYRVARKKISPAFLLLRC